MTNSTGLGVGTVILRIWIHFERENPNCSTSLRGREFPSIEPIIITAEFRFCFRFSFWFENVIYEEEEISYPRGITAFHDYSRMTLQGSAQLFLEIILLIDQI